MPSVRIAPSILNADMSELGAVSERLMDAGADFLHLDVMDGHFVPNMTFGAPVIKCLRNKLPTASFEAHMNVSEPKKWINDMKNAGVNLYTFHIETTSEPHEVSRLIREAGMRAGIAISPITPWNVLEDLLDCMDSALVMTVVPGFGGQAFMTDMLEKVRSLRELFPDLDIGVDGGVSQANIYDCVHSGANYVVCGSSVVKQPDYSLAISNLRRSSDF